MPRLALLLLALACGDADAPPVDAPDPVDDTPPAEETASPPTLADVMTVTAEVIEALRGSPDHRAARADALIAEGDPAAILAFVRDEIGLLPPTDIDGFVPAHQQRLMGAHGALRGGAGSMRDKAELLAWMMEEAGYPARVGAGVLAPGTPLAWGLGAARPFAPAYDDAAHARWSRAWGGDVAADPPRGVVDASGRAEALAAALTPLVDPSRAVRPFDLEPSRQAAVEITLPTGIVWGNPNHPDATLDDPRLTSLDPEEPARERAVYVRAWARQAGTGDVVELVDGTWPLPSLVGKRLSFRMRPAIDVAEAMLLRPTDVPLHLPTWSVDDPHASADAASVRTGDPITVHGDAVAAEDGAWRFGDDVVLPDGDQAALAARVTSLEVEVDPRRFDEVVLRLIPRDRDGAVVPGLTAPSFDVTEDGQPLWGTLTANAHAPRVLLLFDRSTSVPAEFRGEAVLPWVEDVARATLAVPGARIGAMAVGETTATWHTSTEDLLDDVGALPASSSALWQGLGRAVATRPSVVLFVTDASATDTATDETLLRLRQADAPVVVIGVGEVEASTADAMAEATGGRVAGVEDPAEALEVVREVLADDTASYELVAHVPRDGPPTRTVTARIGSHEGRATYTVPLAPVPRRALAGLYLTVEVEGREQVTRTLAGIGPDEDASTVPEDALAAVQAASFGVASLVVEGGAPGLSEVLADHLTARLSLADAVAADDDDARLAAWSRGFLALPLEPMWLLLGLGGEREGPPTVPLGPRIVLWTDVPGYAPGQGRHAVDVLVSNRWSTLDDDPEAAFWTTFRRTLQLAALEEARYETSTATLLAGRPLTRLPARDVAATFPNEPQWTELTAGLDDDWDLLVPADGAVVAAWAVHAPTGTVIGLLPDQSGGGSSGSAAIDGALRLYDTISELHSMSGLGGGFWVEFEIAKAKVLAYATVAIMNLGGWSVEVPEGTSPEEVITDAVCGAIEDAVSSGLPDAVQEAIEAYNRMADLFGLPPASAC